MVEDKIIISQKTIYKNKVDESACKQAFEFILKHKDQFIDRTWDCDIKTSINLTNNILNVPDLRILKLNILSHLDNFMTQQNNFFDGYIDWSWVNIYEKKFYQEFHRHVDSINKKFSGIVYLTENNSKIQFDIEKAVLIEPKFCDILIFEDDLEHRVWPNEENLRISLAFNFVKKQVWKGIVNGN